MKLHQYSQDLSNLSNIDGFPCFMRKLRVTYQNELSQLAFTAIPDEKKIVNTIPNTIFNSFL
jgi:hypothetical protein